MNFRASTSCSLCLLFLTLLMCSCITVDKTLGKNFIPTDHELTLSTENFDLPVDSRLSDSLQTNNHYFVYDDDLSLIFGACQDPVFGLTESGAVFQFVPWKTFSYGENPEPVSLTLCIVRKNIIVLDQTQVSIPQNVFVHEITSELSYKNAYNNSLSSRDWNPTPISQPGQQYFGSDTINISLSLDYARRLLDATQEEKDSSALFLQRYPGLYIKTELPNPGTNTGRLNIGNINSVTLLLQYKLNGADSSLKYSAPYSGIAFNSIKHSNGSLDPHPSENIYYQGFAGYKPYIDFVSLVHNIQTWTKQTQQDVKKLLINRAEILLSYDPTIDYRIIDQYPTQIYPYIRTFTDTTSYYRPIDNIYASNSDGVINRSKYQYSMNITTYLQSLLKKEEVTEKDNVWLMESVYTVIDDYGTGVYHFPSSSYPLATFKGTGSDAKPILRITYTFLQ